MDIDWRQYWHDRHAVLTYAGPFPGTSAGYYSLTRGGWRTAYIYVLFDVAGNCLYVGRSHLPGNRFDKHRRDKRWWPDVHSLVIAEITCDDRDATDWWINSLEVNTIRELDPVYNIIGRGESRYALVQDR